MKLEKEEALAEEGQISETVGAVPNENYSTLGEAIEAAGYGGRL